MYNVLLGNSMNFSNWQENPPCLTFNFDKFLVTTEFIQNILHLIIKDVTVCLFDVLTHILFSSSPLLSSLHGPFVVLSPYITCCSSKGETFILMQCGAALSKWFIILLRLSNIFDHHILTKRPYHYYYHLDYLRWKCHVIVFESCFLDLKYETGTR